MQNTKDFLLGWIIRSPVLVTFISSLALSLIAVAGVVTVGKDAAFYLDLAQQTSEHGIAVAQERFNWPWFILLLAGTHKYLGVPLELAAYLWCAVFMAGTCALLVDSVRRRFPAAAWWACLVVLAMPAFNEFRTDILREFGFWFFSVLTFWFALRWQVAGGWWRALSLFPAILCAALFRLEALLLLPALALWQLPSLLCKERRARAAQLYALLVLLAGIAGLGLLLLVEVFAMPASRLVYYANLLNPSHLLQSFSLFAEQFGDSMTYKYSRDDAGKIIFFGMLATLLIKFGALLGPFAWLLLDRVTWKKLPLSARHFPLFAWAALLYLFVLMVFFIQEQFTISRYGSFLNLLVVPQIAWLLYLFAQRHPRLVKGLVVAALLVMLANVVSLGGKKTHYIEAGRWLSQNVASDSSIYYDDPRIAYYAGWGYPSSPPLEQALADPAAFRYLLIEADGDEPWLLEWLQQHELRVLARFANRKDDAVLVIGN